MPHTDTCSRDVQAPPARVFAALIDRDALLAWLPPSNMRGEFEHFDLRPGGSYRLVLTYRDPAEAGGKTSAGSDVVDVRIVSVEPDRELVQAVDFVSDDPAYAGTMTMTWRLTPTATGTRVDIVADDVPDGIASADHAAGMTSSLDNLARYLEGGVRFMIMTS